MTSGRKLLQYGDRSNSHLGVEVVLKQWMKSENLNRLNESWSKSIAVEEDWNSVEEW